jgi:hypothetical protein
LDCFLYASVDQQRLGAVSGPMKFGKVRRNFALISDYDYLFRTVVGSGLHGNRMTTCEGLSTPPDVFSGAFADGGTITFNDG